MIYRLLATEMSPPESLNRRVRSVFCTASSVLAGKVEENFHKLASNFEISKLSKAELKLLASGGADDVRETGATSLSLPAKWGELTDEHFPLFLSFDDVRYPSAYFPFALLTSSYRSCPLSSKANSA